MWTPALPLSHPSQDDPVWLTGCKTQSPTPFVQVMQKTLVLPLLLWCQHGVGGYKWCTKEYRIPRRAPYLTASHRYYPQALTPTTVRCLTTWTDSSIQMNASFNCSGIFQSSMYMCHYPLWRFCAETAFFPLCCIALAHGPHRSHSLTFCMEYYLWLSDWLKLLKWLTAQNPPCFICPTDVDPCPTLVSLV